MILPGVRMVRSWLFQAGMNRYFPFTMLTYIAYDPTAPDYERLLMLPNIKNWLTIKRVQSPLNYKTIIIIFKAVMLMQVFLQCMSQAPKRPNRLFYNRALPKLSCLTM